ncbi:MAG: hypothetical protein KDD48_02710 [Bdellovibrionales bacterium]|nr:hypothetical protein [Bdellovibrionales bacterium]
MTFTDITRMMLTSMDFFELRRTAARYAVPFQGVRRQKLIKEIERKILTKNQSEMPSLLVESATVASLSPEGAVSAKPSLKNQKRGKMDAPRINTFSARNTSFSRV